MALDLDISDIVEDMQRLRMDGFGDEEEKFVQGNLVKGQEERFVLRVPQPTKFNGENKDYSAAQFLWNFQDWLSITSDRAIDTIPVAKLHQVFGCCLDGKANEWFCIFRTAQPAATWSQVKAAFLGRFKRLDEDLWARTQLHQLKQGRMSVNAFTDMFKALVNKINPALEEKDVRFRYTQGLRQEIGSLVAVFSMDQDMSLEELARMAQRLESQQAHYTLPTTVAAPNSGINSVEVASSSGAAPMELGMISAEKKKFQGKCWFCDQPGHVQAKCFKRRAAQRKPKTASGGNGGAGDSKKSQRAQ